MDIRKQRRALIRRRGVGKPRHGGVEQLPRRAAEFRFEGFVAQFAHDGVAFEGGVLDADGVDGREAVGVSVVALAGAGEEDQGEGEEAGGGEEEEEESAVGHGGGGGHS